MARTVIGQRFKLSGMHWTAAIAIATLRCQRASGPAGQRASRPDLLRTAQPEASRLTRRTRQTNLVTYKNDTRPPRVTRKMS